MAVGDTADGMPDRPQVVTPGDAWMAAVCDRLDLLIGQGKGITIQATPPPKRGPGRPRKTAQVRGD